VEEIPRAEYPYCGEVLFKQVIAADLGIKVLTEES